MHGMASQAWRNLHLVDKGLSLVNNSMYVAMESLQCQNASTALKLDKKTICQQANQAGRHLLTH